MTHPATPTRRPSAWRWLGIALLLLALATAAAAAIGTAVLFAELPSDLSIVIDGETVELGLEPGHAWAAFGAMLVALVVALVVVPLALLCGLGVPLLIGALVLLAMLLMAGLAIAVVASPLILLGLLVWWAARPRRATPATPPRPTTPPPVPVVGQHTDNATPLA